MSTAKKHTPERLQPPPLWKAGQVAEFLQMSPSWVYSQAEAGKIPCRKLGGAIRFDAEEIKRWAAGEQVETRRVQVVTPLLREPKK